MTDLEKHVLKTALSDIKAIRESLGVAYISTVNLKEGEISKEIKEELSEQHKKLIVFQSRLHTAETTINLVIANTP